MASEFRVIVVKPNSSAHADQPPDVGNRPIVAAEQPQAEPLALTACKCRFLWFSAIYQEATVLKCAVLLLLLAWPAGAQNQYTFAQWERLQDEHRVAFIAGYFEILATMAATQPTQTTARHHSECIVRSRLTPREFADYLREYGRARPQLHGSSVQHAIDSYLDALCGRAPN
ncbi:MAG TPA: hypothetical protein VFI58_07485 [Xanthobacteraceae bacterium]|nr:hypothetical protein [Xanthobacteraceae bacterium]